MDLLPITLERELIGSKIRNFIADSIPQLGVPIISKGENWARVNDILIMDFDGEFKVSKRGIKLAQFGRRAWAIAYAVAYCRGDGAVCRMLLENELRISKYSEDINLYSYRLKQAENKGDYLKQHVFADRLSRTQMEYQLAVEEVTHLIKSQYVG